MKLTKFSTLALCLFASLSLTACQKEKAPQADDAATQQAEPAQQAAPAQAEQTQETEQAQAAAEPQEQQESQDNDSVVAQFTAVGNADGVHWRAVLDGDKLRAEIHNGKTDVQFKDLKVERSAYAKGAEFTGKVDGQEVLLNIRGEECQQDGKSYEFTAILYYGDGDAYQGCAARGALDKSPT